MALWASAQGLQFRSGMTGLEFLASARAFAGETTRVRSATLTLGRRIVNQEAVGGDHPADPFMGGEHVYAHTAISPNSINENQIGVTVAYTLLGSSHGSSPGTDQGEAPGLHPTTPARQPRL